MCGTTERLCGTVGSTVKLESAACPRFLYKPNLRSFSGGTWPLVSSPLTLRACAQLVGVGPGRRVNGTQGVDAIDVTSAVLPGAPIH